MKTCVKCGEKIHDKDAITWEEGPIHTFICPECYAEENNYYEEPEEEKSTRRNNMGYDYEYDTDDKPKSIDDRIKDLEDRVELLERKLERAADIFTKSYIPSEESFW
jgi:hypothetical protein